MSNIFTRLRGIFAYKDTSIRTLCKHLDVEVRSVHPKFLTPKTGLCKICKKRVKAKIVWE